MIVVANKREVTEIKHDRVTLCDICGLDVDRFERPREASVEIRATDSEAYYDSSSPVDIWITDVCIECFYAKVRPALEAIGAKFREVSGGDPAVER